MGDSQCMQAQSLQCFKDVSRARRGEIVEACVRLCRYDLMAGDLRDREPRSRFSQSRRSFAQSMTQWRRL